MSYYRQGPQRPPGGGYTIGVPGMTPYVKMIMIASGVLWLLQTILLQAFGVNVMEWFGVVPAKVIRGWLWQLLTYIFLHNPYSPMHLIFNMLMLWMFGSELERHWGSKPFLNYYLVSGAGGGLCAALFGLFGDPTIPTVGASGALFGLFVAYAMVFGRRTILFALIFPMQARTMVMILIGIQIFYLLSISQGGNSISYIAHLGGALAGFLYLKRAWKVGDFYRELRWKMRRRKFKMMSPEDPDDRWLN